MKSSDAIRLAVGFLCLYGYQGGDGIKKQAVCGIAMSSEQVSKNKSTVETQHIRRPC